VIKAIETIDHIIACCPYTRKYGITSAKLSADSFRRLHQQFTPSGEGCDHYGPASSQQPAAARP